MRRFCVAVVAIAITVTVAAGAQPTSRDDTVVSILAFPHALLPLATPVEYFTTGFGADAGLEVPLPFLPALGVRTTVGYSFLPVWTADAVNVVGAMAGPAVSLPVGPAVLVDLHAGAGYYYGMVGDGSGRSGGNALFGGGLRVAWNSGPGFSPGIDARYTAALNGLGGLLYHGLELGVSTRFNVLRHRELQIEELELERVFPVLYKTYTEQPFGSATLVNASQKPVENLAVTVYVEEYMDSPWECLAPASIAPGESVRVDMIALFNETAVLSITEATVVSARITATYTQDERRYQVERPSSLRIMDRHAITWDDDRKAAAYVTYKDPTLVDIATIVARVAESRAGVVDANLRIAMALHEAFRAYGLAYRIDPASPYIELSETTDTVDYLQFPRNTLKRRAGDCDDLSILYTAALQALGIETAFVTIPGHIYMAFALKSSVDTAGRLFSEPDTIIIYNERAWVPVEITLTDAPFMEAWKTGARQWTTHHGEGTAAFYPVPEAWKIYEPVGQVGDYSADEFIAEDALATVFTNELDRFISREIFAQTERYQRQVSSGRASPQVLNRVGAIHARFGDYAQAAQLFQEAAADGAFPPALLNLGSLAMVRGDAESALDYFNQVEQAGDESPELLLQLSRAFAEMGDYEASSRYYERLAAAAPELAERHRYLDLTASATGRASSRQQSREEVPWVSE